MNSSFAIAASINNRRRESNVWITRESKCAISDVNRSERSSPSRVGRLRIDSNKSACWVSARMGRSSSFAESSWSHAPRNDRKAATTGAAAGIAQLAPINGWSSSGQNFASRAQRRFLRSWLVRIENRLEIQIAPIYPILNWRYGAIRGGECRDFGLRPRRRRASQRRRAGRLQRALRPRPDGGGRRAGGWGLGTNEGLFESRVCTSRTRDGFLSQVDGQMWDSGWHPSCAE